MPPPRDNQYISISPTESAGDDAGNEPSADQTWVRADGWREDTLHETMWCTQGISWGSHTRCTNECTGYGVNTWKLLTQDILFWISTERLSSLMEGDNRLQNRYGHISTSDQCIYNTLFDKRLHSVIRCTKGIWSPLHTENALEQVVVPWSCWREVETRDGALVFVCTDKKKQKKTIADWLLQGGGRRTTQGATVFVCRIG